MPIIQTKTPWIPECYTLDYHHDMGSIDIAKGSLALHLEPEQEKESLEGRVLLERTKEKSLNSAVLKYLYDNSEYIPDSWKGKYVHFWGTIFWTALNKCVLCLYWNNGAWYWGAGDLNGGFGVDYPSAVLIGSFKSQDLCTCVRCEVCKKLVK